MGNNNNSSSTTLFLMMLMLVLLFFVMKPGKNRQQDSAQHSNTETSANASEATILTDNAPLRLAEIVKEYGSTTDEGNTYIFENDMASLTAVASDSIRPVRGTFNIGPDTLDVEAIFAGDLPDMLPEKKNQVRGALGKFINNFEAYKSFAPFFYGENQEIVLKNDVMTVTFASKGGLIQKVTLNNYLNERDSVPTDVMLFDASTGSYGFTFATSDQRICTDSLYFKPVSVSDTSVVMSLPLGNGADWQLRYSICHGQYLVKMELLQQGMDALLPPSTSAITFDWRQRMVRNEVGRTFEERKSGLYYKYTSSSPKNLNPNKKKTEDLNSRVKWVAFKNQFFSSVVIAQDAFTTAQVSSTPLKDNPNFVKYMTMQGQLPYSTDNGSPVVLDFYFGPNNYPLLTKLDKSIENPDGHGLKLNRLVPLGWGLFRWINQLIVIPVFTFLSKFTNNYGIIILLLTIFIKLIIFPFTYKSYMSQAKMRVLAPEIKEINEKYPGDENAMKRQQETMALYGRVGASPFSGCLPMLLQMPVLIAMFAFFPSAIELRGQSFLWAHDLSAPDYICKLPFTIPFYGNHVSLFCLLMTVTNIIYTKLNMQSQPATAGAQAGAMKWMMYLMPLMFLFFFNDYASGLSYYYFLSLLITILQTWIFRKCINEQKVRAELLENAKKPKQNSGCMGRLGEMQKQQEAMMREQAKKNGKKRR